jgi:hypothetical protein
MNYNNSSRKPFVNMYLPLETKENSSGKLNDLSDNKFKFSNNIEF